MQAKAPRRTRDRILDASLRLFNAIGEPNVSATAIAEELGISPGNLYYHFRSKDDIVNTLFERFDAELSALLQLTPQDAVNLEDIWLFLQANFESMWRYRFIYRDLNELLSRNHKLETRFKLLLTRKTDSNRAHCVALADAGMLRASAPQIDTLVTNMVVITSYWLSFEYIRHARRFGEPAFQHAAMMRGAHQVMALLAPYLTPADSERLASLIDRNLKSSVPQARAA